MNLSAHSAAAADLSVRSLRRHATASPTIVISLDFELRWGSHDRLGLDMSAYRENLEGVQGVVPELLRLFRERQIRATWATVGAVACRGWDEYFKRAPKPPRYKNPTLAVDPRYADLDPDGRLHFAPDLVDLVRRTPGQELGTHTFSHLPLREPGVTAADVFADLAAVRRLWMERIGETPRSIAFPRNQPAFLDTVHACGIRIHRGNPNRWYYRCNDAATNGLLPRLLRLLDDTNPWSRHASRLEADMTRASLFLRADLPAPLWRMHVTHARRELTALRPGQIFHLWWHPHNLGCDIRRRLGRVAEVLDAIAEGTSGGPLVSRHMGDLAS
jgi:peptidoglycan/xylan/chitin deacetylase (PgdA/CDA1 family)